ncbi:MAG: 2Fe-2S iron-sulfur cluster binding domain-containing protein [Bacteroidetes bacterium]|nr:2Fe-2S iron-sulfur cluster binding domain-containing protein [Bacteroidota bacterium]
MLPFDPPSAHNSIYHAVRIEQVVRESKDASTFILQPVQKAIDYLPGQFLTFVFGQNGVEYRRSYSISSSQEAGEPMAVTIKRVPNGIFSRALLDHAEAGDILTIVGGATGFFTLEQDLSHVEQIFFLAAGSGITPVYPIIQRLLHRYPEVHPVLIYSNRARSSAIFRDKLHQLEKDGRMKIEWLFSDSRDLRRARLGKTLLQELLSVHLRSPIDKVRFYLCGPFDYMRMATIVLQNAGANAAQIHREIFAPLPQVVKEVPPDKSVHQVTILTKDRHHTFTSAYPDSILSAAKKLGIVLPYSCEAGRCGSCVAQCVSGKVWMRYNEVLTDNEIARGRVLVCQSFPVGGDVELTMVESS